MTAPGFESANVTVSTGVAGNYTTVSLVPVPSGKGTGGIPLEELAVIVGGVVAVGVAAVIAVRSGRGRIPPEDPGGRAIAARVRDAGARRGAVTTVEAALRPPGVARLGPRWLLRPGRPFDIPSAGREPPATPRS